MSLQQGYEKNVPRDRLSARETDGLFSLAIQINYEDTDAGGVVYYGNYLGYMERARNAYLRSRDLHLTRLQKDYNLVFVVTEANLRYHAPAVLDDEILVTLEIEKMGAASVWFRHKVMRKSTCLVNAGVRLATVDSQTFQPFRIPEELRRKMLR